MGSAERDERLGVVFVHGFTSSPKMWKPFTELMAGDPDLGFVRPLPFGYATKLVQLGPLKRIPSFDTVADSLKEYLDTEAEGYRRLALVGHSQGGLVIQRCLTRLLGEGRGRDLERIRRVVLFACPNTGSEVVLGLRRGLLRGNPQEAQLRPLNEQIADVHRSVLRDVVNAREVTERSCPIPFSVYAGEADNIVPPASARSAFPDAAALPGGHSGIVRPDSHEHRSYRTLRRLLLRASADSDPPEPGAAFRAPAVEPLPPLPAAVPSAGSLSLQAPSLPLPLPAAAAGPVLPLPAASWQGEGAGGLRGGVRGERLGDPYAGARPLAVRAAVSPGLAGLPPAPEAFTARETELAQLLAFLRPPNPHPGPTNPTHPPAPPAPPALEAQLRAEPANPAHPPAPPALEERVRAEPGARRSRVARGTAPAGAGPGMPGGPARGPARGVLPVTVVSGMGGVGKSALVLRAAQEAEGRGWFPGGTVFLNLHGHGPTAPLEPGAAAARLLRALGARDDDLPPTADELLARWRSRLAELAAQDAPVLLVLDNALDAGQVAPLLAATPAHRVLVTSRHTLPTLDARPLHVPVLESAEGALLIDRALRVAVPEDDRAAEDPDAAGRIAELCGGLPLALLITAAVLRSEPDRPLRELADELADNRLRLDALDLGGTDAQGREFAVRAAFDLSYRHLPADQSAVFRLMTANPGPDVSTAAMAALTGRPAPQVRRALAALARAHLVARTRSQAGDERWSLHDLVRLYALELGEAAAAADARDAALDRLLDHYVRRARAVRGRIQNVRTVPAADRFAAVPEALAWLEAEAANLVAAGFLALGSARDPAAFEILRNVTEYLLWWSSGEELVELTRTAHEHAVGGGHAGPALEMLLAHAGALVTTELPEDAVAVLLPALTAAEAARDHEAEAMVRTGLCTAYRGAKEYEEAVRHGRRAVELIDGSRHPRNRALALNSLGNSLRRAGHVEESVAVHRQTAAIARRLGDRHFEAFALNNLGNALTDLGDHDAGMAALRSAVTAFRSAGDRHGEFTVLVNLAHSLRDCGRRAESAALWLEISGLMAPAGEFAVQLHALAEAARIMIADGNAAGALEPCRAAVEVMRASGRREGEGLVLRDIASLLGTGKQFAEGCVPCAGAITLLLGEDRRLAESILASLLAGTESQEGPADPQARELLAAAEVFRAAGLSGHEGRVRNSAGLRLQAAGRPQESVAVLQRAVVLLAAAGERTMRGHALNNLGIALRELGRHEESERVIREDLAICREDRDGHGEAVSLTNLAETLAVRGDRAGAAECLRTAAKAFGAAGAQAEAEEARRRADTYDRDGKE